MLLFQAIKNKSMAQFHEAIQSCDLHARDELGRTPLHCVIINKAPVYMFDTLLRLGADIEARDDANLNVLEKAIQCGSAKAVERLVAAGASLDHPLGITFTPWFMARKTPPMADLLLATKGAIRLTLRETEIRMVENILYSDAEKRLSGLERLNTSVLVHAFILRFHWHNDWNAVRLLWERGGHEEITAYEIFDRMGGEAWMRRKAEGRLEGDSERRAGWIVRIGERYPHFAERAG